MTTAAVIAEYNPFHMGHAYQLQKTLELTGADRLIVFMSADFVQRGEPAIIDKYTRAAAAIKAGADAVFELPLPVSLGSAGNFAYGGVKLINSMGFVDFLSFGCENDDPGRLEAAAESEISINSEAGTLNRIKALMGQGLTYPEARDNILISMGMEDLAKILSEPNNNLAISYIEALIKLNSHIKPVAIPRTGGSHADEYTGKETYASASSIRRLLKERDIESVKAFLPDAESEALKFYRNGFINNNDFSDILFYKINEIIRLSDNCRSAFATEMSRYSDVSRDISLRVYKYYKEAMSYDDLAAKIWSKNLTYGRIDRVLQHIIHNITSSELSDDEMYFHPIAIRRERMDILTEIKKESHVPLIMRLSDEGKIKDRRAYINTRLSYSLYKRLYKTHHDIEIHDESGKEFTMIL